VKALRSTARAFAFLGHLLLGMILGLAAIGTIAMAAVLVFI
jgi:hypothetical protein